MKRTWALLWLAAASILLSACSQETDIWLYPDEEWKIAATAAFDPAAFPTIGVSGDVIPGLRLGANMLTYNESLIDAGMDRLIYQYQAMGAEANWRKAWRDQERMYTIEVSGQGWDLLRRVAVEPPALQGQQVPSQSTANLSVTDVGNGQIQFVLDLPSDPTGLGMLIQMTYRLHGSQIVSSNANRVEGGTAIWSVPQSRMFAILTPAPKFLDTPVILAIVGGGVLIGGAGLAYFLLRSAPSPRRPGLGMPTRRPQPVRRRPLPKRRRW